MSLPSAGLEVQHTPACNMPKPSTAETKLCANNAAFSRRLQSPAFPHQILILQVSRVTPEHPFEPEDRSRLLSDAGRKEGSAPRPQPAPQQRAEMLGGCTAEHLAEWHSGEEKENQRVLHALHNLQQPCSLLLLPPPAMGKHQAAGEGEGRAAAVPLSKGTAPAQSLRVTKDPRMPGSSSPAACVSIHRGARVRSDRAPIRQHGPKQHPTAHHPQPHALDAGLFYLPRAENRNGTAIQRGKLRQGTREALVSLQASECTLKPSPRPLTSRKMGLPQEEKGSAESEPEVRPDGRGASRGRDSIQGRSRTPVTAAHQRCCTTGEQSRAPSPSHPTVTSPPRVPTVTCVLSPSSRGGRMLDR